MCVSVYQVCVLKHRQFLICIFSFEIVVFVFTRVGATDAMGYRNSPEVASDPLYKQCVFKFQSSRILH